jgi:hypothetical protein
MGLMDILTGGKNEDAARALRESQARFDAIRSPTVEQLTLPQLQQYVNAGLMTPAQMEAYLQKDNAYTTENVPQTGTAAQIAALNQLSGVANAGAAGTPVEQAQQAQTIQAMNQAVGGNRGAAEQAAAARGTPAAMIQMATSGMNAGQDAQQAYQNALQGQAQAYQQAVNAMAQGGQLGGQLQGQQNTQANTVAAAQNAMQQFNAQNQQNASLNNAQLRQQAGAYNTENAQNVANQNTGLGNQRTMYNTQLPQQVFNNQMQKASGQANISGQQAGQATGAGQQEAGLFSGLIGAGATMLGGPVAGLAAKQATAPTRSNDSNYFANNIAHGGIITDHEGCYHGGGICLERGGMIPGKAKVSGDSLKNDVVTAHVSPGEAVIPRTSVQANMPEVLALIAGRQEPQHHPKDIASLLSAMKEIRMGATHG